MRKKFYYINDFFFYNTIPKYILLIMDTFKYLGTTKEAYIFEKYGFKVLVLRQRQKPQCLTVLYFLNDELYAEYHLRRMSLYIIRHRIRNFLNKCIRQEIMKDC